MLIAIIDDTYADVRKDETRFAKQYQVALIVKKVCQRLRHSTYERSASLNLFCTLWVSASQTALRGVHAQVGGAASEGNGHNKLATAEVDCDPAVPLDHDTICAALKTCAPFVLPFCINLKSRSIGNKHKLLKEYNLAFTHS